MARIGRKTKYTPETVNEICKAIREGSTQNDAACLAGITTTTFHEWINTKPEFSEAVEKAHADFKRANVAAIRAAGVRPQKDGTLKGQWQANAWLLERKYPDEFGQRITIKIKPEDQELLKRHNLTPDTAWRMLMEDLANDSPIN